MCGLIGLIDWTENKFDGKDQDLFKTLLVINSLRGASSTGAFGVDKYTYKADLVKSVGSPFNWFNQKNSSKFMGKMFQRYGIVVGHGRFATQGNVSPENAHPFAEDGIFLVHNGHISNTYSIKERFGIEEEVDSHVVTKLMAKIGIEEALKKIEGAFAFIIYDQNNRKLHIVRNRERPLFLAQRADKEQIVLASESGFLELAFDRLSLKMTKDDVRYIQDGLLYTFNPGDKDLQWASKKVSISTDTYVPTWKPNNTRDYFGESAYELDLIRRHAEEESKKRAEAVSSGNKVPKETKKSIRIGKIIHFFPVENKTMEPKDGIKDSERTFVRGIYAGDDDIKVVGWVDGDFSPYLSEELLCGEVFLIHQYEGYQGFKYQITVKNIKIADIDKYLLNRASKELIKEEEKQMQIKELIPANQSFPKADDIIQLLDGSRHSRASLDKMLNSGCIRCANLLKTEQSGLMVTEKDGLLCPTCTAANVNFLN